MKSFKDNNKAERAFQTKKRFKRRVSRIASMTHIYVDKDGKRIKGVKTDYIMKDGGMQCYRHQATPCSCFMCSPDKYNRTKNKKQVTKRIKEELDD
jgi:hypothetical protein